MSLFHLISFYFLPLLIFILFLSKFFSNATGKNLPPSPPKVPILGNLHQLGMFPHRSLQSLAQKHGPLMRLRLGNVPVLFVSSAFAACEIMKTHDRVFSSRPKSRITSRLFYGSKDVAFVPYGDYWRQVRSICVIHLLSNKRVQSFRNVREEETALMINKIVSHSHSSSSSSSINLTEMFALLVGNIVCRVTLGRKYEGRRFKELLGGLVEVMGVFNVGDYIPWLAWITSINGLDARVEKLSTEMDGFLEGVVEEHIERNKRQRSDCGSQESEGGQDFVDSLLEIQREKIGGSSPVHRDTIKALIMEMFIAGTDTTFIALEWTMAEILKHPKVMKKLQNEVREIARGKMNVTEDDIEKMVYLKAVIKEALRLHTPSALLIPRESMEDVEVMGYEVAAGTQVIINAWAISRDPFSWVAPEEFLPERFLSSSIDFKGHDFELIPFGAGRRGCPGTLFALNVIELALANVVHRFDLSLPGGGSGEDLDMSEAIGIDVHKKNPLIVVATPYSEFIHL